MTKAKRIRQIYGIVLSISLVLAGICLMASCVGIYRSGDKPYSPAAVAAAFSKIAVAVYPAIVLVIGSFLLDFVLPSETTKSSDKQYAMILRRLHEKHDVRASAQSAAITAEQTRRKIHWTVSTVLLVLGSLIFLSYGANPANFDKSEITPSMIGAMRVLLPCMAVPFGYSVFAVYYTKRSMQREIALVRQAIAAGCPKKAAAVQESKVNWLLLGRCALLCVGLGVLVYGLLTGGTADVLTKAINICTECVGLG